MSESYGQEYEIAERPVDPPGGLGGKPLSEMGVRDQRIIDMAIRRGWLKGQRFATDASAKELQARVASGTITGRERAMLTVLAGMSGGDGTGRREQIAAGNFIAMERLNQADEFADIGLMAGGTNVNVNVNATGIALETREDFYGTAKTGTAKTGAAKPDAASDQGAGESGAVQGGGMRPPLGEVGDGVDGAIGGARCEAGGLAGSD